MTLKLMGKFKNDEWEDFDTLNPDFQPDLPTEDRKKNLLNEYKATFGQGYLFKWVEVDD